jgi:hypothetical protein
MVLGSGKIIAKYIFKDICIYNFIYNSYIYNLNIYVCFLKSEKYAYCISLANEGTNGKKVARITDLNRGG